MDFKIGDKIKIINMEDEPNYIGKEGVIERIDDIGQLHGTWGGLAIIPEIDEIELVTDKTDVSEECSIKEEMETFEEVEEVTKDDVKDGVATTLTFLIKDEWEAYEGYKSAIATLKSVGVSEEVMDVLEDILAEELLHVGQLQKCLELVEGKAVEIKAGEKEAEEQLDDVTSETVVNSDSELADTTVQLVVDDTPIDADAITTVEYMDDEPVFIDNEETGDLIPSAGLEVAALDMSTEDCDCEEEPLFDPELVSMLRDLDEDPLVDYALSETEEVEDEEDELSW